MDKGGGKKGARKGYGNEKGGKYGHDGYGKGGWNWKGKGKGTYGIEEHTDEDNLLWLCPVDKDEEELKCDDALGVYNPNMKLGEVPDWLELLSGSKRSRCWQVVGRWLPGAFTQGSTVYSKTHRRFMLEEEKLVGQGQPRLENLMEACGGVHRPFKLEM